MTVQKYELCSPLGTTFFELEGTTTDEVWEPNEAELEKASLFQAFEFFDFALENSSNLLCGSQLRYLCVLLEVTATSLAGSLNLSKPRISQIFKDDLFLNRNQTIAAIKFFNADNDFQPKSQPEFQTCNIDFFSKQDSSDSMNTQHFYSSDPWKLKENGQILPFYCIYPSLKAA